LLVSSPEGDTFPQVRVALPKHLEVLTVICLLMVSCTPRTGGGGVASLKSAGDTFLQRLRWRDFRGAAELIIPERRERFDRIISSFADESDLTVSDYQLEDVRLSATDAGRGFVIARLRWVQMPSVSEKTAVVTSEFVYRGGSWFLGRQDKGPFVEALGEPLPRDPK
jgi:hypothetical protein